MAHPATGRESSTVSVVLLQTRPAGGFDNRSMNIFEALRLSHDTQRALADSLIATSGDSPERDLLFRELKLELAAHAAAEERFFYVPLIAHDMTQEPSRHGIAEHHQMDKLVETLENTDASSPGWLVAAKALHHKVYHHLKDEEQGVFQLAGKVLSEAEKLSLAKDYEGEFVSQRTKPAKAVKVS
ncbi:MAG: hemerythrin protein [Polaromonas sp.]|nr:hemerythrin protein [Polaromonas sp.]